MISGTFPGEGALSFGAPCLRITRDEDPKTCRRYLAWMNKRTQGTFGRFALHGNHRHNAIQELLLIDLGVVETHCVIASCNAKRVACFGTQRSE